MVNAPTSGGGIDLHRAMEHERAAVIFHTLARLRQYPSARVTIETYEDATITYSNDVGDGLIEDIQCKKIEEAGKSTSLGMDDWWAGPLTRDGLKSWLEESRRGDSSIGRLAKNPNRYFTLLAYAEPSKGVKKYVPPGVGEGGFTRSPATEDYFPLDFAFADDPDPGSPFTSPSVGRKIRIVPLGPRQFHLHASIVLHKFYDVIGAKTPEAFRAVEYLLYGHLSRAPEKRTFTLPDIESVIKPFRLGSGKWTEIGSLIAAERQRTEPRKPANLPFVTWSDFDTGQFIQTDMIRAGAAAIARHDFIVVAGYNGCGKTVVCKYLAHTYLASRPDAKCFYLQATPGDDLRDELDIFQSQLAQPVLFIVDDAQFSEDSIKAIAQAYVDRRLTASLAAKLVIATTETSYSPAQREGRSHPLDEAYHVKSDFLSAETAGRYLAAYRAYRPSAGRVADSSIVSIAGGQHEKANMGVALVLAYVVNPQAIQASQSLSLESDSVRSATTQWLASMLDLTREAFEKDVAAVFTVCSFGLSIGSGFSQYVERLAAAGFLVEANDGATLLFRLRPEYSSLAWVVSRQHLASHNRIFKRYAELHNTQISHLVQSLSSDDAGRRTLLFLLQDYLDLLVPPVEKRSIDLAALAIIIASASQIRRRSASDFIRLCFRHGEKARERAIMLRGSIEGALKTDVRPLIIFLNAVYRADQVFAEKLGADLIGDERDLYRLITEVRDCPSNLLETMQFLAAAKNCDVRFGTKVAPELARSDAYEKKWREVIEANDPMLLVRTLNQIRQVNRRLFVAARTAHLTEASVSQWIRNIKQVDAFVGFLSGVRQLSPRIASYALRRLSVNQKSVIASLIADAESLSEATLVIAGVSRVDRRVATRLAEESLEKLVSQVGREPSYNNLGSGLGRIRRATTSALAKNLAIHTSLPQIAEDMQREKRRFELLGRTLDQIADIAADIASEIAGRLNYGDLYSKVNRRSLLDFAHLTRGLYVALRDDEGSQLLSYIRNNANLSAAFHRSLFSERSLHQIADALATIAAAGLRTAEIFRLFGSDEVAFREFIRKRMKDQGPRPYSDLEIANALFALAQLDPAYAAEALASYADVIDGDASPASQSGDAVAVQSDSVANVRERVARRFDGGNRQRHLGRVDLAGAGALLQMSSAIDDEAARALLKSRQLGFGAASADKNLGRHSIFLLGLHNVSRTVCLQFMKDVYTEEHAETLFQMAQNPRELIQFIYAVQLISIGECRRIGALLIGADADNIRDYLSAEADLSEVCRWIMTLTSIGQLGRLDAKELVAECSEYDTRLVAQIDSAQAMIVAGISDGAVPFVSRILGNVNQIRGTRKVGHCIQLWLKANYIARELGRPNLIGQLTEAMLPRALELIAHGGDQLSAAFAVRLWLDCGLASLGQQDRLQTYRELLLKQTQLADQPTVRSILAAALLRPTEEQMLSILSKSNLGRHPLWITGMLQVVLDGYVGNGIRVTGSPSTVDPDQNNLKYGLACYAQRRRGVALLESEVSELASRAADESSHAIRPLLGPNFDASGLPANPYYLWVYLRRSMLTLNYLDWDHEVHRANSAAIFRKRSSPDPEPILRAAE